MHPNGSFVYFENNRFVKSHELNDLIANPDIAQDFCPYGGVGDLLWVRESFKAVAPYLAVYRSSEHIEDYPGAKWKPSIHMPRWASRLTLEIENIRVERLQDISEDDAVAEGAIKHNGGDGGYRHDKDHGYVYATAKDSFEMLWQRINGVESWNSNPWVWAIEYKVHKCNVNEFLKDGINERQN